MSDSIRIFRVAFTVKSTPEDVDEPEVEVVANAGAECKVILPVVAFSDEAKTTWRFAVTYQFWLMVWSCSAEMTSMVILCGFPSVNMGTNGVRSI